MRGRVSTRPRFIFWTNDFRSPKARLSTACELEILLWYRDQVGHRRQRVARDRQQRNAPARENVRCAASGFQIALPAEADLKPRMLQKAEKVGRGAHPM
jgi:hypothetical protein